MTMREGGEGGEGKAVEVGGIWMQAERTISKNLVVGLLGRSCKTHATEEGHALHVADL